MTLDEIRKHMTPGEWALRKPIECDNSLVRYWLDGPGGVPIADIKANGHFEANAALLALAPALLDAVDAPRESENAVRELCEGQHPDNECWRVLTRIRAALAKLDGVTP